MELQGWVGIGFLFLLVIVFAGLFWHYYSPKRKKEVEDPKYKMLKDE